MVFKFLLHYLIFSVSATFTREDNFDSKSGDSGTSKCSSFEIRYEKSIR